MPLISEDLDEAIHYLDMKLDDEFSNILKRDQVILKRNTSITEISKLLDIHFKNRITRKVSGS